jgi:hypothetical protein
MFTSGQNDFWFAEYFYVIIKSTALKYESIDFHSVERDPGNRVRSARNARNSPVPRQLTMYPEDHLGNLLTFSGNLLDFILEPDATPIPPGNSDFLQKLHLTRGPVKNLFL